MLIMTIVKNKNGILMPETLKIILAVMGIFILVFATTSFAGIFIKNTGVKQAEDSLEKIYSAIEQVERGEKEIVEVFLESPKGWFITAWPQTQHEDKPSQCETDYCICICKTGCEEEKETYCKKVLL